eukprot:m51a1_g14060 hypothetical protein (247) ;mRNA; r:1218888-1220153
MGDVPRPTLLVSTSSIYRTIPFQLIFVAPVAWIERHGVSVSDIREAGMRATVHHRDTEDSPPLEPCQRCCAEKGTPNVFVSGEMAENPPTTPFERTFVFYRCVSNCNSSRLHLGGRVHIVFSVYVNGTLAGRAATEPLLLQSKTGMRAQKKQRERQMAAAAATAASSSSLDEQSPPSQALPDSTRLGSASPPQAVLVPAVRIGSKASAFHVYPSPPMYASAGPLDGAGGVVLAQVARMPVGGLPFI